MRETIKYRVWIGMFFIMVCCAEPFWLAAGQNFQKDTYENRVAAEKPAFSLATLEAYPAAFEAYYNDRLPFRGQLIWLSSAAEYYVFGASSNEAVVRGKDGWLFYDSQTDHSPVEAYKGMGLFDEEELAQIGKNLTGMRNSLADEGIEFVLFIAPNKERIYPEKMPGYYGAPAETYRVRQLVDYLKKETDIRVVYPCEQLIQAKAKYPWNLYYRLDTHWNYVGAYVGTRALADELGVEMPPLEDMTVDECDPTICDLADMLYLRAQLNTDPDYVLSGYDQYHLITDRHELVGEYAYHCEDEGADPRVLFMVRDSFADAMDDFLASRFRKSIMVHYGSYDGKQAEETQPDIFVYETVERRIGELLEFSHF